MKKCKKCHNNLDALDLQEPRKCGLCSDCYYEGLNEVVESLPEKNENN